MKKISLICAAILLGMSLVGCGQHKDNSSAKLSSLKAENSSLKAKKSNSHRTKHARKNSSSSQSKSSNGSGNKRSSNTNTTTTSKPRSSQQTANKNSLSPAEQANVNKGLEWDGTRKRSSFKSDADFDRYNAWHQGYNYDPSSGNLTPLNDQQMSDMREQMNKDGGQSFQ